jgi:hypothetical protein
MYNNNFPIIQSPFSDRISVVVFFKKMMGLKDEEKVFDEV